jgi:hypothetical protein
VELGLSIGVFRLDAQINRAGDWLSVALVQMLTSPALITGFEDAARRETIALRGQMGERSL